MRAGAAEDISGSALPVVARLSVRSVPVAVVMGIVLVMGAALRLYDLGAESYWLDEVIMLRAAGGDIGSILASARPPVYVLLTHFWIGFFGTSEASTRLLPAIFGVLSILLTYRIGHDLFGKRVGLMAALLVSLSAFQIYYSQETRYYSLFVLCALLSYYVMLRALTTARPLYFGLYAVAGILMFYSHSYAVFVLAAQNLYFALSWKRSRPLLLPWTLCQVVMALAILPALGTPVDKVVSGEAAVMKWIPDPPLWQPFLDVMGYIVPIYSSSKVALIVVLFLGVVALGVVVLLRGSREWWTDARQTALDLRRRVAGDGDKLLLLGSWLVCPILIPLLMSKVFGPMYLSRYTISATPAFYILFALAILGVRRLLPVYVSLALLAALVGPGLLEYYARPIKGEWPQAAAYMQAKARPGDVLMSGYADNYVLSWYGAATGMSNCVTGADLAVAMTRDSHVRQEVIAWPTKSPRVWLATSSAEDPYAQLFTSGQVPGLRLVDRHEFPGISTYLFSRAGP